MTDGSPAGGEPSPHEGPAGGAGAERNGQIDLLRWLRVFGPFAFLVLLDPFGCGRQARLYSENLVLRVAAPFHGIFSGPVTEGQRKVLVVRIDQQSLDGTNLDPSGRRATWPISRAAQIRLILQPILAKKPKAIFLDYTFNADTLPGEEQQSFCGAVACNPAVIPGKAEPGCASHNGTVHCAIEAAMAAAPEVKRLFLGSKPTFDTAIYKDRMGQDCKLPRVTLAALGRANDVARDLREWSADSRVELVDLRSYDPVRYPLVTMAVSSAPESAECGEIDTDVVGYLASPAYAMFNIYCQDKFVRNSLCPDPADKPRPAVYPAVDDQQLRPTYDLYERPGRKEPVSLTPYWPGFRTAWQRAFDHELTSQSSAPDPSKLAAYLRRCERRDGDLDHLFWGLLHRIALSWELFSASLTHNDVPEPCRYGVDSVALTELSSANIQPGRMILVGLDLADTPDLTTNPLYPDTPGVMLHAVALENLITYGANYMRDPAPLIGNLEATDALVLALGLVLSIPAMFPTKVEGWVYHIMPQGARSVHGVLLIALITFSGLMALWLPLAISAGIVFFLSASYMKSGRAIGSIGPFLALFTTFAIVVLVPFLLGLVAFGWFHWAMIDWLVLMIAVSWAPEVAFKVLDEATETANAGSPVRWRLFMIPLIIVMVVLMGIFMRR